MAQSKAFLSSKVVQPDRCCFICCKEIKKGDKPQRIGEKGYERFIALAAEWSRINIPVHEEKHNFTEVFARIQDRRQESVEIYVHSTCRVHFRNNSERYLKNYGTKDHEASYEHELCNDSDETSPKSPKKQSLRSETPSLSSKHICFICNAKRKSDNNPYNEGGLRRCDTKVTANKLMSRKDYFLRDKSSKHYAAGRRLHLLLNGQCHDIFAVDIYYHQSCYITFALKPETQEEIVKEKRNQENDVLETFLYKVKTQIIRDKNAFLLNELLRDVERLSEELGLETPALTDTRSLKRFLLKELEDDIAFFPSGKLLVVHSPEVNPCEYSVATLRGFGLRDEDLSKSFGRMLRRKLQARKQNGTSLPLSPEEFLSMLDQGPLPDLYNAIYYSMCDRGKRNEYGYMITSQTKATKIWSLASDWETLITGAPSPKQAIMGLVLHRITGKLNHNLHQLIKTLSNISECL